jgi:hypothetical protein
MFRHCARIRGILRQAFSGTKMRAKIISWLIGIVLAGIPLTTQGGTIVVSGDTTPIFRLDASYGAQSNQQFFTNVLGGGDSVAILDSSVNPYAGIYLQSFYSGLANVSATIFAGTVTPDNLAGVNLFLVPIPEDSFSASEIAAISSFAAGGGTVFLMGEADDGIFGATANINVNGLLSGLGSDMSVVTAALDRGSRMASGDRIEVNPLTANVLTYNYGYTSQAAGGTPLFLTSDGTPFAAVGTLNAPEPSTLVLLGIGTVGMMIYARRRRRVYCPLHGQ